MVPPSQLVAVAGLTANRLLFHPWKVWFWGDSIGLEGLLDASTITGEDGYAAYVHGLLKAWIAREHVRSPFDYTAPGVALLTVFAKTGDPGLLAAALRHAEYMASFRRTSNGAFLRYEDVHIELPPELPDGHPEAGSSSSSDVSRGGPCVFVDSVHFDGPFFARLYRITGEERYRSLALENILPQLELLFDPRQKLFHHFWMERTNARNGVLWGRGNGWGLLGVAMTLEDIGNHPSAPLLADVLCAGIERLATLQHGSGGWHTILDDPDSYVETSTAAFFVDVVLRAIRLGLIPAGAYSKLLESAMQFLLSQVQDDGSIRGVSYETFPSTRAAHYRAMPRDGVLPWGTGPLLSAIRGYLEYHAAESQRPAERETVPVLP